MRWLRIGLAQLNPIVGNFGHNVAHMVAAMEQARRAQVDVLVFPELAVCGYPPEDLLLRPSFIRANLNALETLASQVHDLWVIAGFVDLQIDLYNAAALIGNGKVAGIYHKRYLPNYGVFDEDRYFRAGSTCPLFVFDNVRLGITICEDVWYPGGPAQWLATAGADVVINLSASPYHATKGRQRERMLATRAQDNGVWFAYANCVGGQDELVFDGQSLVIDPSGATVASGQPFMEELVVAGIDLDAVLETKLHDPRLRKIGVELTSGPEAVRVRHIADDIPSVQQVRIGGQLASPIRRLPPPPAGSPIFLGQDASNACWRTLVKRAQGPDTMGGTPSSPSSVAEVYAALVLGTRDYVRKNTDSDVVIGLSGGIDSSLVCAIAVDALGSKRVHGVSMPGQYNQSASEEDARQLAAALNIDFRVIPIQTIVDAYVLALAPSFAGTMINVAEENLQARTRGSLWMALTNKFNWLALTAGNKSEMATGYATLYGDMAGGLAVLKDVPKTLVYQLAAYRNSVFTDPVIPDRVFQKAPSAELRPDQRDSDSLPPYDVLDPILAAYVEHDWEVEQIVAAGFDEHTVRRVMGLVDRAEYKRRQAPPGIKITPRAFGRDRRWPITHAFRESP